MKRALLNGKDLNMDTDFLKELGAIPDTFESFGSYGTYHRIGFDTAAGRFCAFWEEQDNTLRICCEGLVLGANEALEMTRLNELNTCLLALDLGDVTCRSSIINMEGEHPYLRISFFSE